MKSNNNLTSKTAEWVVVEDRYSDITPLMPEQATYIECLGGRMDLLAGIVCTKWELATALYIRRFGVTSGELVSWAKYRWSEKKGRMVEVDGGHRVA